MTTANTTGEKCEPNLRWNNGELQQLWAIIEYRDGREYERSWEWRDVPEIKPRSPQLRNGERQ